MLCVHSSRVFDTKIVNHKCELKGAGDVIPKAWRVIRFKIPMRGQLLPEEFICEFPGLGESIDAPANFDPNASLVYLFH